MLTAGRPEPPTEQQIAELFRAEQRGLLGAVRAVLGRTDDAAEVLQDACLNALRAVRRGHRPSDASAWVFVVTLNAARDRRRQSRRRPTRQLDMREDELVNPTQPTPEAAAATNEALAAARAAIERLDDAEKDVFTLRVSGGLSFDATAAALSIPIGTAKTRMRAALARLRRELSPFAPDPSTSVADARALGDVSRKGISEGPSR